LLFAITHTLFQLDYLIHLARISTNADQALDVFYISDRAGNKIVELERMRTLRASLIECLDEPPVSAQLSPSESSGAGHSENTVSAAGQKD